MRKTALVIAAFGCLAVTFVPPAAAQATTPAQPNQSGNDPSYGGGHNSFAGPSLIVYSPRDTMDRRIDLYMADWHESMPRSLYGSLVLRDILTRGDYFSPPQRGAILPADNYVAHATLGAHASTTPSRLDGEQEVYYIAGGAGRLTAGGAIVELHKDVAVFVPANLEFTMTNTGDQLLTMYIINEPTYPGFHPIDKVLAIDERKARLRTPVGNDPYIVSGSSGHWGHIVRELFAPRDGLATLSSVITVELPPLSLGEPHPHRIGTEEVWTALEGNSLAWLAAQVRMQRPGMSYMVRPDTVSTHSNINFGDSTIKFLYFAGHRRDTRVPEAR